MFDKIVADLLPIDYNTYIDKIKNETKRYEKIWNKYNEKYFKRRKFKTKY